MPEDRPAVTLRGFRPSDVPFVSAIVADALHEHYDPGLYPSLSAEWPEGFLVAADPDEVLGKDALIEGVETHVLRDYTLAFASSKL